MIMFWSKLCKSNRNCAWSLAFISCICLTYCMEYVWTCSLWIGFFLKSYTKSKNTIYRVGAAVVSTITSSHSSRENATPSSGTSPIASCKRVSPPPGHFLWLGGSKTKTLMNLYWKESVSFVQSGVMWRLVRAFDRPQKKSQISRDFQKQNRGKIGRFRGNFRGKLGRKTIGQKKQILWLFLGRISWEIDRFCPDQTSVFYVFLTEVIICSFNNNTLQKWTSGKAFNIMASAQFFAT